jgi:hypothetical protein
MNWCPCGDADCDINRTLAKNATVALNTAPQAPLKLSDEQIDLLWRKTCEECKSDTTRRMVHMFARAVLAAAQPK